MVIVIISLSMLVIVIILLKMMVVCVIMIVPCEAFSADYARNCHFYLVMLMIKESMMMIWWRQL